ncbi:MAG: hypothetical protein DMG57_03060 [Acidobacteria bacterium]|nr:MAG: hypothetical protein DMG57_03060 [Acidobacteriota bacterium]
MGRASVRTFQLNQIPGALSLRITVAKEFARAGAIVKLYVVIPGGRAPGLPRLARVKKRLQR